MTREAPESVDVVRIVKEIRESIARGEGVFAQEQKADELARGRLRSYAAGAGIHPAVLERLLESSHNWNIAADYLIRSHRPGVMGQLSVLAKKAVRPLVRLYTDQIIGRQAQLNLYFLHLLRHLVHDLSRLQAEATALRERCDVLERDLKAKHSDRGDGPSA